MSERIEDVIDGEGEVTEGREYIPALPTASAVVSGMVLGQKQRWMRTSIVAKGDESKQRLARCLMGEDALCDDLAGETIKVCDIVQHVSNLVDPDTDEPIMKIRTVLLTDDGRRVSSHSDYVALAIQRMLDAGIEFSQKKPVPLTVKKQKSRRKGRQFLTLELA